jgi:HNH endonuclease
MESKKDQIIALLELGWSFRRIAKEVGCSISAVSFHANNHGLLDQESKGKFKTRYDWKEVQRYHDEGHGMRECMRYFGFATSTWSKAIARGDIVPRSHIIPLEKLLVADRGKTARTHLKAKLIKQGLLKKECAICGITEWMGKPLAFDLDHINGVNNDNRLENLRLLCPNCHSQTETHAGKNILLKKKRLHKRDV